MALPAWVAGARGVRDGEPVNAAVANRPVFDLLQRDEYLKALIDALHLGEALYLRERAVEASCYEGCVVYYDAAERRFAPALAVQPAAGVTAIDPRALVAGVVEHKHSATVADIVLAGAIRLDPDLVEDADISGPQ